MKRTTFARLLATASFTIVLTSGAQAQDAALPVADEQAAQRPESEEGGIAEIVVTATRREERLQDVPIAISAFGAAELEAAGAENVQDLAKITPGLTIANQSAGITPFIRGVGAVDNTVGQESAVAIYVDGVYYPSVYASLFSFNNIERIEVLKGPQGTLFGRNATGGLIHVFTRDPQYTPTMSASVSYGNYETVRAQAYVSGGLTDTLAMDLALMKSYQGEGFGRNVTLDRDVGFVGDDSAIRSKLLWTPTADTTVTLSGDYSLADGSDLGNAKSFLPGSISTIDGLPAAPGFHNVRGGAVEFIDTEQWGGSLRISHDFGGVSAVSLSALRDSKVVQVFDNDATPVVFLDAYIDSQKTRTYMQELQILSDPSSSIAWIVGAFFLDDSSAFADPLGLGLIGGAVGGTGVLIKNEIKTRSYSAFGEVTVPLGERTEVTAGARWTSDKRSISGRTDILDAPSPDGNIILSIPSESQSFTENQPTWRLVLNHNFTDDVMAYASYNRGFKSGNFNTVSASDEPFKSETVDAFEVGLKSQLFDNRLRFNAAAFYYSYRNLQLSVLSGSFLTTTNAADSTIKGFDLDGEWAVTDNLRLRFGAAFLDTKFDEFLNAQCSRREPNGVTVQFSCDASGNDLTRSPEATFNISPSYRIETDAGRFDATLTYAYNSGFFWEPDNRLKEPAYSLLSGQIGWTDPTDTYGIKLFGKNLTNEDYTVWTVAFALGDEYAAAPPRTYGVELSFNF